MIRPLSLRFWLIDTRLVVETCRAGRQQQIQVKLGHDVSFPTGTLLQRVKGSWQVGNHSNLTEQLDRGPSQALALSFEDQHRCSIYMLWFRELHGNEADGLGRC